MLKNVTKKDKCGFTFNVEMIPRICGYKMV